MHTRAITAITATLATVAASLLIAPSAAIGAVPVSNALTRPMSAALAAELSRHVDKHVIVILKSQLAPAHVGSAAARARASKIANNQAPIVSELKRVSATHIKAFGVTNSLAATVSAGEVTRLKANSAVAKVIPDSVIHLAAPAAAAAKSSTSSSALTPNVIPGACAPNGGVQLDPEGLSLMHVDSDDPHAKTARSLGFTGAGVKVAYIADGIDPNNVNFLRDPNKPKSSVFSDVQDFTGDGPGQVTGGAEAFLDANSIAGQGKHVYNLQNYSAQPTPSACNIRIEGVAPGASLVGLNVFGSYEDTTESNFLQAINYAVQTSHVNVLNESFGQNPFPDVSSLDTTVQFNDAAVAAGVTVTVSSGDAGSTNTIGSPASDPKVIAVGASTDLRSFAQTNDGYARDFATTGWLNNNISSFSSSGFTESGGTVSLVAPGDSSFSSCDASDTYAECTNDLGQPSDVESAGGTSESAPLTAGTAALVIEAYAKAHGGANPTPALVKQILVSTADDLGAPAAEQGAGIVNAYKAVQLAASITTKASAPKPQGATLLKSVNALQATAAPGRHESWPVTVTNTGSVPQIVGVSGRAIGPDTHVQTGGVTLSDSSPTLIGPSGAVRTYQKFTFTVARGQDRLDASISYAGDPASGFSTIARLALVDPTGRYAAYSSPQGIGNFGDATVIDPTPGTWSAYVVGNPSSAGGLTGKVLWRTATEQYVKFGHVSNSHLLLAPGQSKTINVSARTPSSPGDTAGSIVFTSDLGLGGTSTLPVTLRSTIDVKHGGQFSGTLTGGNGRDFAPGQSEFYNFTVGKGVNDITANVTLKNDAADPVGTYLVSPDGNTLGYGQNSTDGTSTLTASAWTLHPVAGTWTLIVAFAQPVVGNELSQPFSGTVAFNQTRASALGMPSADAKLKAGVPITVPVTITNNGAAPEDFFVDPRLNTSASVALVGLTQTAGLTLPLTGDPASWFVPTQSSALTVTATGSLPIMFDMQPFAGDPDISSRAPSAGPLCSTTESANYSPAGAVVTSGGWFSYPSECGPYKTAAPAGTASLSATVVTKPFDTTVTSDTGDAELTATDPTATFTPVTIAPGKSAIVHVTVTPTGASGTKVSGTLYVDDYVGDVPPYGQFSNDELFAIPYSYTIK